LMLRGGQHRSLRGLTRRRHSCLLVRLRRPIFEHANSVQFKTPWILGLGQTEGMETEGEEDMERRDRRDSGWGNGTYIHRSGAGGGADPGPSNLRNADEGKTPPPIC